VSKRRKSAVRSPSPPPATLTSGDGGSKGLGRIAVPLSLAGLTVAIGVVAATLQPYDPGAPGCKDRTPPDETAHVLYVRDLLRDRALPMLTSGGGNYEAHQPPLYYVTVAPWMALGRGLGVGPSGSSGAPTPEVWFGRLWSVLIAAGVTITCYLLACAVFPRNLLLQAAVPLFALLLPGHILNLAAITNDGLAELFAGLVIWLAVGLIRRAPRGVGRLAALGLLTGAALLTKTVCVFLLPVVVIAVAWSSSPWRRPPPSWRRFAVGLALTVGLALALWAPWIAHNLSHYPGDPLVTRTFVEVFGKDRWTPERFYAQGLSPFGYWHLVLTWTYLSFWGVFGSAMVFMPGWYYLLATVVCVAALVGFLLGLSEWRRADRPTRYVWSLVAVSVILVALQFLSFNRTFFQAQARYLFPAIAPIACLFAAGVHLAGRRVGGRKGAVWAHLVVWAVLAVLLIAALAAVGTRGQVGLPTWL
jgi:4-amino-4-deoxy-L-arabinose transferase-like glycosyltransferase